MIGSSGDRVNDKTGDWANRKPAPETFVVYSMTRSPDLLMARSPDLLMAW